MLLQNKQSPWKIIMTIGKNGGKKKHKKQTKMIKNNPKTRIKANQHHKQLGYIAAFAKHLLDVCVSQTSDKRLSK